MAVFVASSVLVKPLRLTVQMNAHILPILTLVLFALNLPVMGDDSKNNPQKIIFDTDIGNDVDDVLALGMIHALQDRNECELLAVTITKDHSKAAAFTDAVNTFYGRGNIPIGVCRSGITPEEGKFNSLVDLREKNDAVFPQDVKAEDAVVLLRQVLSKAEDHSLVIVQVGFSTNLANLLKSSPDEISELSGIELVQKKVSLLSIMAGAFQMPPDAEGKPRIHREYNVIKDLQSARFLSEKWPTRVVWSGFEIGIAIPYPHQSIQHDFEYVLHHPLKQAYYAYNPPPHDRPTWDLTSVLYAIRPHRNYFKLSSPGVVQVNADGVTTFQPIQDGRHQYLQLTEAQKIRVKETLVCLASQPPQATPK